jgi:hypothetical protein
MGILSSLLKPFQFLDRVHTYSKHHHGGYMHTATWHHAPTGIAHTTTKRKVYSPNGKLIKQEIIRHGGILPLINRSLLRREITYSPPGRLFGKRHSPREGEHAANRRRR